MNVGTWLNATGGRTPILIDREIYFRGCVGIINLCVDLSKEKTHLTKATMRTQEEIVKRFEEVDDIFGTQKSDLLDFMTFENGRQFVTKEYSAKVDSGEETWVQKTDAKSEILGYLNFAYGKAEDERGLSAARSMLHFKTWIWIDDQKFYDEIVWMIDDYTDYGIPTLNKIAEHYSFVRSSN